MASKLFSTKVIDELSKLREDLNVKSAVPEQESDMGSEALLKDLYGDIMDNTEYDVTQDPAYSSLKKTAYRESDRTMRDVLAQGNARTNGFANSAAVTAASQARDYTMSQFDDKVADLEDRALSKQNAKISAKMQLLSAIEGMEATKRQNYLDDLERLEQQAAEEKSTAESEALNIIKLGGVPSDELLSRTGWSQEYIAAIKQNTYDSMDTASMQRYLNSQGASLTVDGSWGPKTEAAYQAVFGQPSGRQTSYGYPRYSPSDDTPDEPDVPTGDTGVDYETYKGLRATLYYGKQVNGTEWAENKLIDFISNKGISQQQANDLASYLGLNLKD